MPILLRPSTSAARIIGGPIRRTAMNNGVVSGFPLINSYDGPDSVYVPLTTSDFSALNLAAPTFLWPCQDTSGDLVATVGSNLTNQGAGTHVFQQSISGWTRKAVGSANDNEITNWRFGAGNGPIPSSSNSVAWLGYFYFPSLPASNRICFNLASQANAQGVNLLTTGVLRANATGGDVDGTYNHVDGRVHPVVMAYNRATSTFTVFSDKERINGTFTSTPSDSNKGIGSTGVAATCVYRCLWLAAFQGTNAEQDWPAYLRRLGWSLDY